MLCASIRVQGHCYVSGLNCVCKRYGMCVCFYVFHRRLLCGLNLMGLCDWLWLWWFLFPATLLSLSLSFCPYMHCISTASLFAASYDAIARTNFRSIETNAKSRRTRSHGHHRPIHGYMPSARVFVFVSVPGLFNGHLVTSEYMRNSIWMCMCIHLFTSLKTV